MPFNNSDISQINNHGLTLGAIDTQIHDFENGFPYMDIVAPATVGDGIIKMTPDAMTKNIAKYDEYRTTHKIVKFVPASGAATRMFKDLFEFLDTGIMNPATEKVINNLTHFAFWDDLSAYIDTHAAHVDIVSHIIGRPGLNYGNLPKGLLKFHKYSSGSRTAVEEHLAEGAQYAAHNGMVNIHFTVSPEHIDGFEELLTRVTPQYEHEYGVRYNITMSCQDKSTDTIAVNPDNTPFRTDDGKLLFRPAGHGALIENLNAIDADVIFIKNIDNVCTASTRRNTVDYKRALAGHLIRIQEKIFAYLTAMDNGTADICEIREFITNNLGVKMDSEPTSDNIRHILNRPIRVCGMVRNTGAPGGGPFWTHGKFGPALQIVESSQIAPNARDIMNTASHFNPVDIVCATRDYMGRRFNLNDFIDTKSGFISEKSHGGRPLRAMERPGLWNGAMSDWTTVFIETPADTFTPAKTVNDLISTGHILK